MNIANADPWVRARQFPLAYGLMLGAGLVFFFWIRSQGETLTAPPAEGSLPHTAQARDEVLPHVLFTLAAVVLLGRGLGKICQHLGQPPVIGEVLAGIALGPSLLNLIHPDLSEWLLPSSAAPYLKILAQFGVILYMFLVGLELNTEQLRARARSTLAIAHASIVLPFLLGCLLSLYLYPRLSSEHVSFTNFALFLGVAMAITAFPVLARILTDQGLSRTELGTLALTCAAAGDVTAWCLLALVVGVAQSHLASALLVGGLALAYLGFMFLIVRPWLAHLANRHDEEVPRNVIALVFVALLLSALATDMIGIHALFGAFLLGAMIPHESALARIFEQKLGDLVTIILVPAFFAYTGLRTQIGLVSTLEHWLLCGLIILVATLGKFGGTALAARATGLNWRTASALGILMNTRGLMELIVLNVGLDLGLISPTLFTMMVIMALATTLATTPVLRRVS